MANTQAFCDSAKPEFMRGLHALGASVVRADTGVDQLKMALYHDTATINASTTAYTTIGEITGGGYTTAGEIVPNTANNPSVTNGVGHWTPNGSIVYSAITQATAFNCALLYNDDHASDAAIAVFTFGSQTVTAGDFTLTMPIDDDVTGLLRLS